MKRQQNLYSNKWLKKREDKTYISANRIIPHLIQLFNPNSVIDIGAANGVWLKVFEDFGISNYKGIDGPWIDKENLLIPQESFMSHNLSYGMPSLDKRFDLAICIEVAEHLPANNAEALVRFLCEVSDIVIFSAAIPMQGGKGHINERPQSYWANLFAEKGYDCFDVIRPKFWLDEQVNVVYRQNMLIYIKKDWLKLSSKIEGFKVSKWTLLDVIHPELYQLRLRRPEKQPSLKKKIKSVIKSVIRCNKGCNKNG